MGSVNVQSEQPMYANSSSRSAPAEIQPEIQATENQGSTIDRNDALCVFGFALYLAWISLVLLNPLLACSGIDNTASTEIVLSFFLGEAIASCTAWVLSGHMMSKTAFRCIVVLVVVLTPLPGIGMVFGASYIGLAVCWGLAGFGAVYLLSLWASFLARLVHKKAILYPAVAVLFETIVILAVLYLFKSDALIATMIALPIISVGIFASWGLRSERLESIVELCKSTKPPDWKSLLHSSCAMVANGTLLGFVLFAASVSSTFIFPALVLFAMAASSGYKIFDSTHGQRFEVSSIIKVLAPTAAIGFLLLPLGFEVKIICCVFMMLVATLDEVICWSAVCEYMRVYRLVPFANIAFGRLGDVVGLALGYFCAYLAFGPSFEGSIQHPLVLSILVILFVLSQAFFFRDNYTPFSEHKALANADTSSFGRDALADMSPSNIGPWRKKCMEFAKYYQLTPRQGEMLVLLAKGYSTAFIREELVISDHTVKAHIYNIYRKLDIHSRQELIELLEEFGPAR
jgi:DNA-binding CsgD family transcriptional regulator